MEVLATTIRLLLFIGLHRLAAPWPYENEDECIRDTSCDCSFHSENNFTIRCPSNEPMIRASVLSKKIDIVCKDKFKNVYSKLPNMTFGDMEQVTFVYCPFPSNYSSIKMLLNDLGIEKTRELILRQFGFSIELSREHLSGSEELERLSIIYHWQSGFSDDIFDNVRNLKSLEISSKFIVNPLPNKIFRNLPKLEFIKLTFTNLEKLTSGIFLNQRKLKSLNLEGNNIKKLTKGLFEGASSILELNLSDNELYKFEPDVFTQLTNLSVINLSWNSFTSLPSELFNKNLSQVLLNNNRVSLVELPPSFLSNLPKLEDVSISYCGLNSVPYNLFHGSTKIVDISLSDNKLQWLDMTFFENQSNLLNLDLSHNELTKLHENLFATITSLEILDLSFNSIKWLESSTFRNLRNLQQLFLNDNQLYSIEDIGTSMADSLVNLQLQNNNFFEIFDFAILRKLQFLNLCNNSIRLISELNSLNLTQLDLSYNKIESVDVNDILSINSFNPVNLYIDLSHNRVETINFNKIIERQQNGSKLENHIRILLNNNPLQCDCQIVDLLQFIRNETRTSRDDLEILLGNSRCAGPEEMIGKKVETVNAIDLLCLLDSSDRHCPESCECKMRPADKAMIINCSSANLSAAPNLPNPTQCGMEFIELYIENNNITALPSKTSQSEYNYVTKICANHNRIDRLLPENIPDNLSTLELANNQLNSVNLSVLDGFNKTITLTRLLLGHNPWICDCSAKDFYYYAKKHNQQIADLGNISCPHLGAFLIGGVVDLCPEYEFVTILVSIVVALLIGMVITLLAALYYKYQRQVKVWLFTHNLCLRFITEDVLDKDKKYDAFISYSHKDVDFQVKEIVPFLEKSPHQYKLCLHDRDWLAGAYIPDSIARSVEDSRRTIIILSPNFLGSVWANMEFRMAHTSSLLEGRAKVIIVIYGDIGDTANLDSALKSYLETNTYVKWGDPLFWRKLSNAISNPKSVQSKEIIKTRTNSSDCNQLELRSF